MTCAANYIETVMYQKPAGKCYVSSTGTITLENVRYVRVQYIEHHEGASGFFQRHSMNIMHGNVRMY